MSSVPTLHSNASYNLSTRIMWSHSLSLCPGNRFLESIMLWNNCTAVAHQLGLCFLWDVSWHTANKKKLQLSRCALLNTISKQKYRHKHFFQIHVPFKRKFCFVFECGKIETPCQLKRFKDRCHTFFNPKALKLT